MSGQPEGTHVLSGLAALPEPWRAFPQGGGFPLDPPGLAKAGLWPARAALVGPMGAGKSSVGPLLAERLGWDFVDLDRVVEGMAQASCAEIIEGQGLEAFRHWEAQALATLLDREGLVLACGGGAPTHPPTRQLLRAFGPCLRLEAPEAELWARVGGDPARPLAQDPGAFAAQLAERSPLYASLGLPWSSSGRSPEALAGTLAEGLNARQALPVPVPGAAYEAWVGLGALGLLPQLLPGEPRRLVLAIDGGLPPGPEEALHVALEAAGWGVHRVVLAPGDAHKTIDAVLQVADAAARARVGRAGPVVALGGGMVGDVAGLAAALHMRGVPWIQVPTTLLGMIDAGIGGKVACNRPTGKNLLGAFHQPSGVLVDPNVLGTLPPLERAAGLGELAKYALIGGGPWLEAMIADADALRAFEPEALLRWIPRAIALKAAVVAEDATERPDGPRTWLNLGHTLAHAIEKEAGYGAWPHGLAVAVGTSFAAHLTEARGRWPGGGFSRTLALLQGLGLPHAFPEGLEPEALIEAMGQDKKNRGAGIRFVLPQWGAGWGLGPLSLAPEEVLGALEAWRQEVGVAPGPA